MSAADLIDAIGQIRSAFSGTMPRWLDGFRGALEVLAARLHDSRGLVLRW
jgi:hypothetical protein